MYKNALQSFCRFYKGETVCPFKDGDKQMFWLCENGGQSKLCPSPMPGVNLLPLF